MAPRYSSGVLKNWDGHPDLQIEASAEALHLHKQDKLASSHSFLTIATRRKSHGRGLDPKYLNASPRNSSLSKSWGNG